MTKNSGQTKSSSRVDRGEKEILALLGYLLWLDREDRLARGLDLNEMAFIAGSMAEDSEGNHVSMIPGDYWAPAVRLPGVSYEEEIQLKKYLAWWNRRRKCL